MKRQHKVKTVIISSKLPVVLNWPVFVPVDANATCLVCGATWNSHGLDSNHCPPCSHPIYARNRKTKWTTKIVDHCNKPTKHKGACAVKKGNKP